MKADLVEVDGFLDAAHGLVLGHVEPALHGHLVPLVEARDAQALHVTETRRITLGE